MRQISSKTKKYLTVFIGLMIINTFLTLVLLRSSLAQSEVSKSSDQPPITAFVASQPGSPISIEIVGVDNSKSRFQSVNFTARNASSKPIRGYVIWGGEDGQGKIISEFFPTKPSSPRSTYADEMMLERENIKGDKSIVLTVDYVEFADGTSWGNDFLQESAQVSAQRIGALSATSEFLDKISRYDLDSISSLLVTPLAEIEVPSSEMSKNFEEKRLKAYRSGYLGVVRFLKANHDKGREELVNSLVAFNKDLDVGAIHRR